MAVDNHSAQLLPQDMSGHNVSTKAAVVRQLGNMHGKCLMSHRYFKLCDIYTSLFRDIHFYAIQISYIHIRKHQVGYNSRVD